MCSSQIFMEQFPRKITYKTEKPVLTDSNHINYFLSSQRSEIVNHKRKFGRLTNTWRSSTLNMLLMNRETKGELCTHLLSLCRSHVIPQQSWQSSVSHLSFFNVNNYFIIIFSLQSLTYMPSLFEIMVYFSIVITGMYISIHLVLLLCK